MSYSDFTLAQINQTFGVMIQEDIEIFSDIPEVELDEFFQKYLHNNIPLAQAIGTEKAKSEMIIAPVLIEARRILHNKISLFSGIDFSVEPAKGLNGFCDFIISLSTQQLYLNAPIITLVEAKNDNLKNGLPQCMAEMIAARIFNESQNNNIKTIYGVVTNGNQWQFMKLRENTINLDFTDYYISNPGKIIGMLVYLINSERSDQLELN